MMKIKEFHNFHCYNFERVTINECRQNYTQETCLFSSARDEILIGEILSCVEAKGKYTD